MKKTAKPSSGESKAAGTGSVTSWQDISRKIPGDLLQVLTLFIATRAALTIIGVCSRLMLKATAGRLEWQHPPYLWLDIWGQWDTGWYMDLAQNWYSALPRQQNMPNYVFFPLYPSLIKGFDLVLGSYFVAGVVISNLCLIGAGMLLYRLVLLDFDEATAARSLKYLFLWPTSFILSAVMTEGLFLFLLLATFYFARKERWLYAGICGFFLCLTRVNGLFVFIPLLVAYLQTKEFRPARIRPDILALALLPLGLGIFSLYNHYLTGDFLAFAHGQAAWGRKFDNPLMHIFRGASGLTGWGVNIFSAWFTIVTLGLLFCNVKKISIPYWLICFFTIMVPLCTGLMSLPRYTVVLFPLFIILAIMGRRPAIDQGATVFCALLQGFLMVFWDAGSTLVI